MKALIFSALLFLSSGTAHAQNESAFNTEEGKYGEERARGDLAASKSRTELELSVCKKSLQAFCPTKNLELVTTVKDCHDQQIVCHAMPTSVATRFISKYGKGSVSANEDALPKIGQILAAFEDFRFTGLHRREVIREIALFAGVTEKTAQTSLIRFFSRFDAKRPPTLLVDFWGYFQQWDPQRPQFDFREDGTIDTVTIAFRFCGMTMAFVSEENIVRDVLAQAIFSESQLPKLMTAEQYTAACDVLEKKWQDSKN